MFAFALTVFFVAAAIAALAVLGASYVRAFAALGGLRRAAANCEAKVSVTIRVIDPAAPRLRPALRVVCSNGFSPRPQPALRAAA
ncbi:MAG: hypothetical protein P0Y56_00145 [Candidatus Andeanibacterium colombiense]|uniref:Uncharacterized protein n=1 Tax=Candidatus Andeanibacterium colombiense TaxID=3121345 RepID=A0AAJ5X678_9SPHN|nr:MAG: hypothetical protein P0Y56_00145 [Sphingomonadaceae bacterium]